MEPDLRKQLSKLQGGKNIYFYLNATRYISRWLNALTCNKKISGINFQCLVSFSPAENEYESNFSHYVKMNPNQIWGCSINIELSVYENRQMNCSIILNDTTNIKVYFTKPGMI